MHCSIRLLLTDKFKIVLRLFHVSLSSNKALYSYLVSDFFNCLNSCIFFGISFDGLFTTGASVLPADALAFVLVGFLSVDFAGSAGANF